LQPVLFFLTEVNITTEPENTGSRILVETRSNENLQVQA